MGMSASQARFLSLTARKNNVEFEGQQINQQRTTLSNESASYYSELCNLAVPTPPSIDDYTKVSYTFNDGAMTNTLISLLPDTSDAGRANNKYVVNYVEEWQDDYAIVPASSSLVEVDNPDNPTEFSIGSTKLRLITPNNAASSSGSTVTRYYKNTAADGRETYYQANSKTGVNIIKREEDVEVPSTATINTTTNKAYIDSNAPVDVTLGADGKYYYKKDVEHAIAPLTQWQIDNSIATDATSGKKYIEIPNQSGTLERYYIFTNADGSEYGGGGYIDLVDPSTNEPKTTYNRLLVDGEADVAQSSLRASGGSVVTDFSGYEYEGSLSAEQQQALLKNEQYLLKMAQEKTGDNGNFYIRYIKNTTTGNYEPYLYAESELTQKQKYNNKNLGSIPCYSLGSTTQTREILNKEATVEKDSSGRYVAITITIDEKNNITRTYALTTTTTTDEEAYNDAMNQYHYAQHEYDHKIQEINSKLEIVQQQDKQLELKLKQLDTEENAISTEMDAVKKVISKNVESSFKTFNA